MASPTARRREVIDLVSDDDVVGQQQQQQPAPTNAEVDPFFNFIDFDGGLPGAFPPENDPVPLLPQTRDPTPPPTEGQWVMVDDEPVWIPHSPPHQHKAPTETTTHAPDAQDAEQPVALTEDQCLGHVLAIFPDVNHEHVLQLLRSMDATTIGSERVGSIVNQLLSSDSYPKHDKGKQKKRKRDDEEHEAERKRWEGPNRQILPAYQKSLVSAMLKAEFPEATQNFIAEQLQTHRHLYQTYLALVDSKDSDSAVGWRGRAPKGRLADAETIAANSGWVVLSDELRAARKQAEKVRAGRRAEHARKLAEQDNLERAIVAGETAECQACFEDLAMNRQIHCNGEVAHFTCFDCAETYIKSEVGDSRCRVLCTAGCGAGFARAQLHLLSDKNLLEKLEQLQQEKDIRDAGLEDLEECPFCDFKVILPPVEEDFELRCQNPGCEKVSCRRCKSVSHTPQSCEEFAKDNKLTTRHAVEEAMTAALIRSCNKCKKQFIKTYGCNKMSCPSCGNLQCYVCSESLKSYDHFSDGPGGRGRASSTASKEKCPLHDNVEERHEREVKEAEAAAKAKILSENPDVSATDLEIKVSDAVQNADRARMQRGAAHLEGIIPPAELGGLLPRRYLNLLGQDEADEDENWGIDDEDLDLDDFDEDDELDEELLNVMRGRPRRQPQARRNRAEGLADPIFWAIGHRLGGDYPLVHPPGAPLHNRPLPHHAQHQPQPWRQPQQQAEPAPVDAARANNTAHHNPLPMHGYIPVFGAPMAHQLPDVNAGLPNREQPRAGQQAQRAQQMAQAPDGGAAQPFDLDLFGGNAFAHFPDPLPDWAALPPQQANPVPQLAVQRLRHEIGEEQRQQRQRALLQAQAGHQQAIREARPGLLIRDRQHHAMVQRQRDQYAQRRGGGPAH